MEDWHRHLVVASGYLELGMLDDAALELEEIEPEHKLRPEILDFRVQMYWRAERWDAMEAVARKLVSMRPDDAGTWIDWAYAARRAQSVSAAHEILLRAEKRHPEVAIIHFNLGCYAGQVAAAKLRVARAIELDGKFKLMALEDPDLEPLWSGMGTV